MEAETKAHFLAPSVLIVALVGGYYLLFGPQTIIVLTERLALRRNLREYSLLETIPGKLPSDELSPSPGTTLSYFGYQFEVPWVGIEKENIASNLAIVYFRSGPFAMFENPATTLQPLKEIKQDQRLISAFGNTVLESNYALYDSALRMTPRQLSVFMPRREAVRAVGLLPLKLVFVTNSESGLFSFNWSNVRGFQCGSPGKAKSVAIHAFDSRDQMLELVLGTKDGSQVNLTQPEINRVVRTLRVSPQPNH